MRVDKLPSEIKKPRDWKTRPDPFEKDWEEIRQVLKDTPGLEAKALFTDLLRRKVGTYQEGHLRTFQRRVKKWLAEEGPDKEVFFPQQHRPGESMQTDFTWASVLGVTIKGEIFEHMLCNSTLPYSNWGSATVCRSESLAALKRGFQTALFRLGRVPYWSQTDNSTAATHNLAHDKRDFNKDYADFVIHFGVKPRTIAVGKKEQNGDIEAANGVLKRMLEQLLKLRGHRDFDSVENYEAWIWQSMQQANLTRSKRVAEELDAMRPLSVGKLPEFSEERSKVSSGSTVRVKHNSYSVPSRLIGAEVSLKIYDDRIEFYYGQDHQLTVERLLGRFGAHIDYRHVISSLVKKPGAFERYRYREELFPTLGFRKAYDALVAGCSSPRTADVEYLRVLDLAASTMQSDVELALELLLDEEVLPDSMAVKNIVSPSKDSVPEIDMGSLKLSDYDALLSEGAMQ